MRWELKPSYLETREKQSSLTNIDSSAAPLDQPFQPGHVTHEPVEVDRSPWARAQHQAHEGEGGEEQVALVHADHVVGQVGGALVFTLATDGAVSGSEKICFIVW